ncbi:AMP-binding protein [Actinocorallia sp. A-T 12471]|uniref:AMP-binding protein n=1 Tax=Actinocorallia sp. A-T 12471 TaxID=3089813 RepID=UPI0029CC272F|nr:AMP-binding protein [Actinocorallia sp. A-T 12471]MDX6739704.1 AMP-binding protein [Actinocorallia sp. A-T 12471]
MVFGRFGGLVSAAARTPLVLARSGLLTPGSPAATVRQVAAFARWGDTLAGNTIAGAVRDPDRPALVDDEGALTYAELNARTDGLARALEPTPRVALLARDHRAAVEVLVACSKLGVTPLVLDTGRATSERLASLRGLDAVVADAEFAPLLAAAPRGVRRLVTERLRPVRDARPLQPTRRGRTDGRERLTAVLSRIPLRVHETALLGVPLAHRWGRASLHLALSLRSTVVLTRRYDAAGVLAAVDGHGCTALLTAPALLDALLAVGDDERAAHDLSSLRVAAAHGGTLAPGTATAFMDAYGEILYTVYGDALTIATPRELLERPGTAGRPTPGTHLEVLREDGTRALPGMPGHVHADSSPTHTVGHLDPEGRLFVPPAREELVFTDGEPVDPPAVERHLAAHPEVSAAAVTTRPDASRGRRLTAYVVARTPLDPDALRAWLRRSFTPRAIPDLLFVDTLPTP